MTGHDYTKYIILQYYTILKTNSNKVNTTYFYSRKKGHFFLKMGFEFLKIVPN